MNEIIKGKRPITPDIAVALEAALGISADYWIRFQSQYDIEIMKTETEVLMQEYLKERSKE